jgi:hypothetical protein
MNSNRSNNRRDFLKKTGALGLGIAGAGVINVSGQEKAAMQKQKQIFNMSGYIAPRLDVVRVAVIGLGNRGSGTVRRLASIEGVEIKALCDLEPDRVSKAINSIRHLGHKPDSYSGDKDAWKKVCERNDIDLVAVVTPWHLHTPMCVFAMEHDKHAYTELPAAQTIKECWQLVETSEKTKKHCVQMSSNCHGGLHAVVLNMVREGFFGDIIHAEGAYIHDLLMRYLFDKDMYHNLWRLKENTGRHGSLYPQHGLVPIMQMMDINYGDQFDYMASISTDDFIMGKTAKEVSSDEEVFEPFVGKDFRGNMNTTIIRTQRGRSIMIQHDVTSPRPDVRFDLISGSKGIFKARPGRIATSHDGWIPEEEFNALVEKYTPEINKRFEELSKQAEQIDKGGHSYYRVSPTDWRLIDCLRNGLPVDMDVYEAAASSSIIPLSELSVKKRSAVEIPDFTNGAWKKNPRGMDINLKKGGGTTKLV